VKLADYSGKIRLIMLHKPEVAGPSTCFASKACDTSSILAIDPGIGVLFGVFSDSRCVCEPFYGSKIGDFEAICGSSGVFFLQNVEAVLPNRCVSDPRRLTAVICFTNRTQCQHMLQICLQPVCCKQASELEAPAMISFTKVATFTAEEE
jgi:hypothetical protein